jgi:hypothetical protein
MPRVQVRAGFPVGKPCGFTAAISCIGSSKHANLRYPEAWNLIAKLPNEPSWAFVFNAAILHRVELDTSGPGFLLPRNRC